MTGPSMDEPSTEPAADHEIGRLTELRSTQTKLVYLALAAGSGATLNELRSSLSLPALSLYPTLDLLIERDLVEREGETYVAASETEK